MKHFLILLFSVALAAQTTVIPKTTVAPKTTLVAAASGVTWTLVQHPTNFTCTGATVVGVVSCVVTASATTAGNLLVLTSGLFVPGQVGAPAFSSASGDSAWTHCPSQGAYENYSANNWESVDCAYILSATGGATSITFSWTLNATPGTYFIDVELLEFRRSTGTPTYEPCGGGGATACTALSASCTTCTGPTPTVTGTDVVVQAIAHSQSITSIASPYNTAPSPDIDANVAGGFAWSLSQSSGNAGVWTATPAGGAAMLAVAFK